MARLVRLYAPRVPQLAQARFARPFGLSTEPAPAAVLDELRDWLGLEAAQHALALHAWVITPDRLCLLATPTAPESISRVIQGLGRRMGSGLQRGRAYAGRYHNALLEPGRWVLPAMVWLESLPKQLGHVDEAARWPWSSATGHIGLGADALLTDPVDYWNEGNTPFSRQAAYRARLDAGLDAQQRAHIEAAIQGQWALGERIFLTHLGRLATRRVTPAPRGRPRKK